MKQEQEKSVFDEITTRRLKEALSYIKAARQSDHLTYKAIVSGDDFKKIVIETLEEITAWNEDDEKNIIAVSEEAKKEKTIKERNEAIKKGLKIGGVTLAGLGIAGRIVYFFKKNRKKTEK